MNRSVVGPRWAALALACGGLAAALLGAPEQARAITYGAPDCADNATNTGCRHPSTVSVFGFAPSPTTGQLVSYGVCSGTLLARDPAKMVVLTAGHCAAFFMDARQNGPLVDVGVSFDAKIGAPSRDRHVMGGTPVLPREFGPNGLNTSNLQFDYAVVVFPRPAGGWKTYNGTPVDVDAVAPVRLAPAGLMERLLEPARVPPALTAVGYGRDESHNLPGAGGNKGGVAHDPTRPPERWYATGTTALGLTGRDANRIFASQNIARGYFGTCNGDSGGPLFYRDPQGVELQVGVTSAGDTYCRASAVIARTEGPQAARFLACARQAGAASAVEACGCTRVDAQGTCPDGQ